MTALSDLIARLEAAKEGSRELDAEIAVAVFETQKTDDDLIYARPCAKGDNCAPGTYWHVQRSGMSLRTAFNYTTSLDAALTLVPEDLSWAVKSPGFQSLRKTFLVELESGDYQWCGEGWTPALALCIAALKAREAAR